VAFPGLKLVSDFTDTGETFLFNKLSSITDNDVHLDCMHIDGDDINDAEDLVQLELKSRYKATASKVTDGANIS
jgi:hypothetical protein